MCPLFAGGGKLQQRADTRATHQTAHTRATMCVALVSAVCWGLSWPPNGEHRSGPPTTVTSNIHQQTKQRACVVCVCVCVYVCVCRSCLRSLEPWWILEVPAARDSKRQTNNNQPTTNQPKANTRDDKTIKAKIRESKVWLAGRYWMGLSLLCPLFVAVGHRHQTADT